MVAIVVSNGDNTFEFPVSVLTPIRRAIRPRFLRNPFFEDAQCVSARRPPYTGILNVIVDDSDDRSAVGIRRAIDYLPIKFSISPLFAWMLCRRRR